MITFYVMNGKSRSRSSSNRTHSFQILIINYNTLKRLLRLSATRLKYTTVLTST